MNEYMCAYLCTEVGACTPLYNLKVWKESDKEYVLKISELNIIRKKS
jgi:hypothetical protein